MLIRSTPKRQEKREENPVTPFVHPAVMAKLVRRLEDRMTILDLASPADVGAFALAPLPGRAD